MNRLLFTAILLIVSFLTACAPATNESPAVSQTATAESPAGSSLTQEPQLTIRPDTVMDWQDIQLENARSGEPFTLAAFSGKTVLVQIMGTRCSPCRVAQQTLRDVRAQFNDEAYVFISLAMEPGLSGEDLNAYAQEADFDWTFTVAPTEIMAALTQHFGHAVVDLPSTPYFMIYSDGTVSTLHKRLPSTERLLEQITGSKAGE